MPVFATGLTIGITTVGLRGWIHDETVIEKRLRELSETVGHMGKYSNAELTLETFRPSPYGIDVSTDISDDSLTVPASLRLAKRQGHDNFVILWCKYGP